jgi:hypothetical protein
VKSCIKEFGSEKNYSEIEGGPLLSKEEVEECFKKYIDELNVKDLITFEFETNTVAPTSVIHSSQDNTSKVNNIIFTKKVIIGLPITYRRNRI